MKLTHFAIRRVLPATNRVGLVHTRRRDLWTGSPTLCGEPHRQPHSFSCHCGALRANGAPRLRVTRRIAVLILFNALFFNASLWAGTQFAEANAQYQKGNFKEAAGLYEKMVAQGRASAAVHYNLGNAYFRAGKKAKALVAYKRALSAAPRDPDIRWNIVVLKSTLPDRLAPKDENIFVRWIREWADQFTVNELSIAFTAILALWAVWALLNFFFPALKSRLGGVQVVILALFIAATAIFFFKWQEVRHPRVVVLEKEVGVRYGPSNLETKAFTLHEGAQGALMDETADWYNIMLIDKNSGWIPKNSCEVV